MRCKKVLFLGVCLIFCILAGCDKLNFLSPKKDTGAAVPLSVKGTLIAKVNDSPITLEELDQDIEAYNSLAEDEAEKITTRDRKVSYLKEEMVRRALLYQEAMRRGLDKKEEIVQALQRTRQDLLVMEIVRQEAERVEVTYEEIENYYNTYKEQLRKPEERRLREIIVPIEQEAKDILVQLMMGADFSALARERSKAPTSKEGGDLGFIQKGKKFAQFDTVAFSDTLEVGKVSGIFKGPEGYYIVKLESKRGGEQQSLFELRDDIKRGLTFIKQQQVIEDLITRLSQGAKLEFYEGNIK